MALATFRYRALMADGSVAIGQLDALDMAAATISVRRLGARPIELAPVTKTVGIPKVRTLNGKSRSIIINLIGELAVLLNASLPLDRALGLAIANVEDKLLAVAFAKMLAEVREGATLSSAMARRRDLFSPAAAAMAEAGEANGRLGPALARLAEMLERAEDLRRLIANAMIYPIALTTIAVGVILLMLLFVVPQFESLFATTQAKLPAASLFVMGVSRFVRDYGWWILGGLAAFFLLIRQLLAGSAARAARDRLILRVPQLGTLVRSIETARFARTLGVLIEGNVALPNALLLARRTIGNSHISAAVGTVAEGVRKGGGLTAPLAATGVFPKMAIGFLRTGEETSQLGPMLERLADVLDREVRVRIQRLIGILTPIITIFLGVTVAAIIASIMSAILGFNDLAISQ